MNTSRLGIAVALLVIGFAAGRYAFPSVSRIAASASPSGSNSARLNASSSDRAKSAPPERNEATEEQIAAAVLRLGTPANGAAFDELRRSLRSWAALNPRAALAYAQRHLTLQRQNQVITEILADWAKNDARAAWAWASIHVPENGTHLDAVLRCMGEVNGSAAWGYAAEFAQNHPAAAQSVYASALRGITHAGDFQLATQLLKESASLDDGVRDGLHTLVATEWGRYEPHQAVAWVTRDLPAGSVAHERAMINVVQAWTEVDPSAAAKHVFELPPGGSRQQAVAQAASTDPFAVAKWLSQQAEPSHDFDQAYHAIATHPRVMEDVRSAVTLASGILDPELRTQSLARIVATWQQRDPTAAAQFLATSPDVPVEMRAAVHRRLEAGDLYAPGK